MFAPNPGKRMTKVEAKIEYTDGTSRLFEFPYGGIMNKKGLNNDRFRKYQTVALSKKKYSAVWPDAARWALRKSGEKHHRKIPRSVTLVRKVKVIPPIKERFFLSLISNRCPRA